ncbi:MAG TPA: glutathione S-transferase family protein [Candidatus Eisenbacteria bacterium]|nr:glutathione S-transferase family protein [Candidatus Eisenbacteria bacterium]
MSRLVLHQPPGEGGLSYSPYCNKVRWALELKGLAFDTVTTSAFKKHSRTGKLPVLVVDGERVHDSTEILRRLGTLHPDPALLPRDPRLAAQATLVEEWADESLCALVTYERAFDPSARRRMVAGVLAFKGLPSFLGPVVAARLRRSGSNRYGHLVPLGPDVVRQQLLRHLDVVNALAEGRSWLVGDSPTIADVAVAACLHVAHIGRVAAVLSLIASRRHAAAWLEGFFERLGRPEAGRNPVAA